MPIEIKELVIKVSVNDAQPASPGTGGSGSKTSSGDNEAIIAACVEQVLEILQQKNER